MDLHWFLGKNQALDFEYYIPMQYDVEMNINKYYIPSIVFIQPIKRMLNGKQARLLPRSIQQHTLSKMLSFLLLRFVAKELRKMSWTPFYCNNSRNIWLLEESRLKEATNRIVPLLENGTREVLHLLQIPYQVKRYYVVYFIKVLLTQVQETLMLSLINKLI